MTTFTFDGWHFFHRQVYDDRWRACTHPLYSGKEGFQYGYFHVSDGRYAGPADNLRAFEATQIRHLEAILRVHAHEMDLRQFDVHLQRPHHHRRVDGDSERFAALERRIGEEGPNHPWLAIALEHLEAENPAYRLTREHICAALERAATLPEKEVTAWLDEGLRDVWENDIGPRRDIQTYEQYFDHKMRAMKSPTPPDERLWKATAIYEVEGVPDFYWIEQLGLRHGEQIGCYYAGHEGVLLTAQTPTLGGREYTYVI